MTDEVSAPPGNEADAAPSERRRSVWVWVILAWASFLLILAAYFSAAEFMGLRPRGPSSIPLSWYYYAAVLTGSAFYFLGALALFNLRARAIPLLALALAGTVADTLILHSEGWGMLPDGAPGAEHGQQLYAAVGAALGLLAITAILVYAVRLRRRGVLR